MTGSIATDNLNGFLSSPQTVATRAGAGAPLGRLCWGAGGGGEGRGGGEGGGTGREVTVLSLLLLSDTVFPTIQGLLQDPPSPPSEPDPAGGGTLGPDRVAGPQAVHL